MCVLKKSRWKPALKHRKKKPGTWISMDIWRFPKKRGYPKPWVSILSHGLMTWIDMGYPYLGYLHIDTYICIYKYIVYIYIHTDKHRVCIIYACNKCVYIMIYVCNKRNISMYKCKTILDTLIFCGGRNHPNSAQVAGGVSTVPPLRKKDGRDHPMFILFPHEVSIPIAAITHVPCLYMYMLILLVLNVGNGWECGLLG